MPNSKLSWFYNAQPVPVRDIPLVADLDRLDSRLRSQSQRADPGAGSSIQVRVGV